MLSVANFNMHAGVDGWGRPYDTLAACATFNADVLVLQEAWVSDADGPDGGQAEQIAATLGYRATTCTMAHGRRVLPHPAATSRWMPRLGFRPRNISLHVGNLRSLPAAVLASPRFRQGDTGSWGLAVLIRRELEVEDTRILHLPALGRDRVRRAVIVTDMRAEGMALSVVGTHMSHLQYGSHRHYADLKRLLDTEARPNAVLLGDMNLWGPPVRAFLPGWRRAVRGRTWPAWSPHSQIDHILVRGALQVASGEVLPHAGSDHRPVRAELLLRPAAAG